jgi:hypothetical protein
MRQNTGNRFGNGLWFGGIALLMSGAPILAQSARVARNSLEYYPDLEKKELAVAFRMVDHLSVTSVQVVTENPTETLPAKWNAWTPDKAPACAWLIVVDIGNAARARILAKEVEVIRSFLTSLPRQDQVAVYTLARDLIEVIPFGSAPEDDAKRLAGIKLMSGAAAKPVIYSNLNAGLARLAERREKRQAVLLFSNGQDQTPGGPAGQESEKQKLIEAAQGAGVVLHTLGYVEFAEDKKYLLGMKEIAIQTDGLFEALALASEELPFGAMARLRGVMHGAGTVRINVAALKQPAELTVTMKTATGRVAVLQVPREKVAEALAMAPVEDAAITAAADQEAKEAAHKAQAAKLAESIKLAKEAASKAEADRLAAEKEVQKTAVATQAVAARRVPPVPAPKPPDRTWVWVLAGVLGVGVLVVAGCLLWVARKRGISRE